MARRRILLLEDDVGIAHAYLDAISSIAADNSGVADASLVISCARSPTEPICGAAVGGHATTADIGLAGGWRWRRRPRWWRRAMTTRRSERSGDHNGDNGKDLGIVHLEMRSFDDLESRIWSRLSLIAWIAMASVFGRGGSDRESSS